MSGVFNCSDVSQLHRAYQELCSANVNTQDVVARLPAHLQEKAASYGARYGSESSNVKQMQLALRDITHEIYDSESIDNQTKIHGIFSWAVSDVGNCQL